MNQIREIYINETILKFKMSFKPEKEGTYSIVIKLRSPIKDWSYTFCGCDKIISLDLSSFY